MTRTGATVLNRFGVPGKNCVVLGNVDLLGKFHNQSPVSSLPLCLRRSYSSEQFGRATLPCRRLSVLSKTPRRLSWFRIRKVGSQYFHDFFLSVCFFEYSRTIFLRHLAGICKEESAHRIACVFRKRVRFVIHETVIAHFKSIHAASPL